MLAALSSDHWILADVGIDWITATLPTSDESNVMYNYGLEKLREEEEKGFEVRAANFRDYKGRATKHLFVGLRKEGSIIRCSGSTSAPVTKDVSALKPRVSRLDVQCTFERVTGEFNLADYNWRKTHAATKHVGRSATISRHEQRGGGYTITTGRRSSDSLGRIYDSGIKSGTHAANRLWRAEAEYHGHHAKQLAEHLDSCRFCPSVTHQIVAGYFAKRGFHLPALDGIEGQKLDVHWKPPSIAKQTSDIDRRLKYLHSVVLPMLSSLCCHGKAATTARSLLSLPALANALASALEDERTQDDTEI